MIRDFAAGERRVKERGELYLPKMKDMDQREYLAFKDRAPFLNATARTVAGLVGVVFRKPPKIELGDANEHMKAGLDSITQDGAPFEVLARETVKEVVETGRFGLLTDMPQSGGQPYIAGYKTEQIVNWRNVVVDGRRSLSQAVLKEEVEAPGDDGFGTEIKDRWRELVRTADGYAQIVHEPWQDDKHPSQRGFAVAGSALPERLGARFGEIPFVFVGPNGLTPDVQRSPILDIVNLNRHHYMSAADLEHGRHYTAIPTYWVSGFVGNEDTSFIAGPTQVWMIPDGGQAGILEFNGQGLTYLENAVADMQQQMAMMGARLIYTPRKAASEASDVAQMRERGEHATLWTIVDSCERALTKALRYWVWWQGGDPSQVRVTLNKDFVDMPMAYRDTLMLMRLWQAGVLSLDATLEALYEGGIIPSSMNPEIVKMQLEMPGQRYEAPQLGGQQGNAPKPPAAK
jgi:hypothetical protein